MINSFEIYKMYVSIKNYYKNKKAFYNFEIHKGASKVTPKSFLRRSDKKNFYKLEKIFSNEDLLETHLFCNLYKNEETNTYELLDLNTDVFKKAREFISSPIYYFDDDISKLKIFCEQNDCKFVDLCKLNGGMNPLLYSMMNSNDFIHTETVLFMDKVLHFLNIWLTKLMKDDFIYKSRYGRYERYLEFIKYKIQFNSDMEQHFREKTLDLLKI